MYFWTFFLGLLSLCRLFSYLSWSYFLGIEKMEKKNNAGKWFAAYVILIHIWLFGVFLFYIWFSSESPYFSLLLILFFHNNLHLWLFYFLLFYLAWRLASLSCWRLGLFFICEMLFHSLFCLFFFPYMFPTIFWTIYLFRPFWSRFDFWDSF